MTQATRTTLGSSRWLSGEVDNGEEEPWCEYIEMIKNIVSEQKEVIKLVPEQNCSDSSTVNPNLF